VKDALSIEKIIPKITKLFGYLNENNFPAPELCPDVEEIRNSYSKRKGAHGFYVKYIPKARALLIAKILLVCQTEQEWHWEYESRCAVFKDSPFVLYIGETRKSLNEDTIWHLMKSIALSVIMKDYINTKWSPKVFDEIKKFDRKFDPTKTFFSYSDCRDLGISNTVDKLICNKGLSVYRQAFKDTVLNRIIDMSRNALIADEFRIESISGVSVLRGGINTRKHIGRVCAEWYRDYLQEYFPSEKMKKLLVYNLPCKEESWEYGHFVVFRKLDDELAVLRVYQYPEIMFSGYLTINRRKFGRFLGKRPSEELRIYVDKKGEVTVMRKNLGHWRVTTADSVRADTVMKEDRLLGDDLAFKVINLPEMLKWTPLRYVYDEIKDELGCISVRKLVGFLRHPILEKISKAGYRILADAMLQHPKGIREIGSRYKAVSNKKGKSGSVYKLLGVNKYILQEAENYIVHNMEKRVAKNDALGIIVSIKDVMQTWDISFLSEESVKRMFRIIPNFFGYPSLLERCDIRRYLPSDMEYSLNIERISKVRDNVRILNKLSNISEKEGRENSISLFHDTVTMYGLLLRSELSGEFHCNAGDIDIWDFDDKNDILRIHNAICDLYNQMEAQRTERWKNMRRKKMKADDPIFKERQRIRKEKYECTDGIFSIVVPKEMTEISKEGVRLHHCVGSYAQFVFHGYTDILFLRRNEDIDTSFYTIEVQNGRLQQIHGLYNRWLGNSPEAIPFVYKWLNERGIVFEKKMLLNTGKGYCSGSKNLDESYLYETAEKAG